VIKNFSNALVVLVTTIPAQKAIPEWLIIHFCSLAKMIFNITRPGWSERKGKC